MDGCRDEGMVDSKESNKIMEVQVIEGQQQTNIEARELAQKTEKWKTKGQTKNTFFS